MAEKVAVILADRDPEDTGPVAYVPQMRAVLVRHSIPGQMVRECIDGYAAVCPALTESTSSAIDGTRARGLFQRSRLIALTNTSSKTIFLKTSVRILRFRKLPRLPPRMMIGDMARMIRHESALKTPIFK
ncbi:hypothetical protein Desti_1897 [Desulfomonile tiedjei DSM 6799]|uniref:Uncharacterized protein n=1 Tax=Desulfomonile tiedjei (strain ATCC 49306 / DSM 6799 / DCB-1) TaxID=706587 RepID=I4C4W4_DESTA|nr:hypothetical protein Desti_1897 [Desulfomonile tiedjei DSM 6799]